MSTLENRSQGLDVSHPKTNHRHQSTKPFGSTLSLWGKAAFVVPVGVELSNIQTFEVRR